MALSPERRHARAEAFRGLALAGPALLWTLAFFLLPALWVLGLSFYESSHGELTGPTLANYARFAEEGYLRRSLWNTLALTAMVVVLSLLLAWPLACAIAFGVPPRWRRLCLILAVLPFWTSYVVRSYAWLLVLAPNGVVNLALMGLGLTSGPVALSFTRAATVMGFVHFFAMLATLTIYASLARIEPKLLMAARDLGASAPQVFARILLPLSLPGMAAAAFLIVVVTIGDYVTPQILGGNNALVLPQAILMQIQRRGDLPMAAMLATVLIAVAALAYASLARQLRAQG